MPTEPSTTPVASMRRARSVPHVHSPSVQAAPSPSIPVRSPVGQTVSHGQPRLRTAKTNPSFPPPVTLHSVQPLDLTALAEQLDLPDAVASKLLRIVDRWPDTIPSSTASATTTPATTSTVATTTPNPPPKVPPPPPHPPQPSPPPPAVNKGSRSQPATPSAPPSSNTPSSHKRASSRASSKPCTNTHPPIPPSAKRSSTTNAVPSSTPAPLKLWSSLRRLWDAFLPNSQSHPPSSFSTTDPTSVSSSSSSSTSTPTPPPSPPQSSLNPHPSTDNSSLATKPQPDRLVTPLIKPPNVPPLSLSSNTPPSPDPPNRPITPSRPVSDLFEHDICEADLSPATRPSDDDLVHLRRISSPSALNIGRRRNSAPLVRPSHHRPLASRTVDPSSATVDGSNVMPRRRFSFVPFSNCETPPATPPKSPAAPPPSPLPSESMQSPSHSFNVAYQRHPVQESGQRPRSPSIPSLFHENRPLPYERHQHQTSTSASPYHYQPSPHNRPHLYHNPTSARPSPQFFPSPSSHSTPTRRPASIFTPPLQPHQQLQQDLLHRHEHHVNHTAVNGTASVLNPSSRHSTLHSPRPMRVSSPADGLHSTFHGRLGNVGPSGAPSPRGNVPSYGMSQYGVPFATSSSRAAPVSAPPPRATTHHAAMRPGSGSDATLEHHIAQIEMLQQQLWTQHGRMQTSSPLNGDNVGGTNISAKSDGRSRVSPSMSPAPTSSQNRSDIDFGALDALSERRRHVLMSQQRRLASNMRIGKVGDVPRNMRLPMPGGHGRTTAQGHIVPNQTLPIDSSLYV